MSLRVLGNHSISMIFQGHDTEEGHDFEYPESSSPYGNVISLVLGGWFSGGSIFMMCFFDYGKQLMYGWIDGLMDGLMN